MKILVVRCPTCGAQKTEIIGQDLMELRKSIDSGLVLLKISQDKVCEHSFCVELDMNYQIRHTYPMEEIEDLYQDKNKIKPDVVLENEQHI